MLTFFTRILISLSTASWHCLQITWYILTGTWLHILTLLMFQVDTEAVKTTPHHLLIKYATVHLPSYFNFFFCRQITVSSPTLASRGSIIQCLVSHVSQSRQSNMLLEMKKYLSTINTLLRMRRAGSLICWINNSELNIKCNYYTRCWQLTSYQHTCLQSLSF